MSRFIGCVIGAWVLLGAADPSRADDAEDKAIALVKKLGGEASRDDEKPGKPVTTVFFEATKTKLDDAGCKTIAALKSVELFHVMKAPVMDVGVKELASLKKLVILELHRTKVTDAGVKELAGLTELVRLSL